MRGFKVGSVKVVMYEASDDVAIIEILKKGQEVRVEEVKKEQAPTRFRELLNGYLWAKDR